MSPPAIHVRSCRASAGPDSHEQIQWVFALQGEMEIEVSGRSGRLNGAQGVFVASGEHHDPFAR